MGRPEFLLTSDPATWRAGRAPTWPVRRRRLAALTVAVVTTVVPLAACAAGPRAAAAAPGGSAAAPAAETPGVPTATGPAVPTGPTTAAAGSDARTVATALAALRSDLEVVGFAEAVLVDECVRRAGYGVRPSGPQAEPDRQTFAAYPSPTPESAPRSGYGIAGRILTLQDAASDQAWTEATEDYKAGLTLAMFGDPNNQVEVDFGDGYSARIGADGCYADVRRSLFGDLADYARESWAASQAFGRTAPALARDDAWNAGLASWSTCMDAAGVTGYAAPGDIRMALFERVGTVTVASPPDRVQQYEQLAAEERSLAVQDADCSRSTGLDQLWIDGVAADDPSGLTAHGAEIIAWADRLAVLAPQARERAVAAAAS